MRKKAIVNTKRNGHQVTHHVQQGDSFWGIAKKHDVSVRALAKWNAMAPGDTLKLGQQLTVWTNNKQAPRNHPSSPSKKNQTIRYTVRNGDSLYLISKKFKVTVNDLKRWNTLNKKYLKPGQTLKIIVDVTRS